MATSPEDRAAALDELMRRKGIPEERRNAALELFKRGRSFDDIMVIVGLKPKEAEKPKIGVGDVAKTVGTSVMGGFATTGKRIAGAAASGIETQGRTIADEGAAAAEYRRRYGGSGIGTEAPTRVTEPVARAREQVSHTAQTPTITPQTRPLTYQERAGKINLAAQVRRPAIEADEFWSQQRKAAAKGNKALETTGNVIAGTTDVLSTMALSALAGPVAPYATGAFYASSSYDEFQQKAREEMGPALESEFIRQGLAPDVAKARAYKLIDDKTHDANFLNALLQGTLDAAAEYVFLGAFPKTGGRILGKAPGLSNAITNALLKLKMSPTAEKAVRFIGNWAFQHGQEEVQNIGQRVLEQKAGIKGSGLSPLQEAVSQRLETFLITGLTSLVGAGGEVNIDPKDLPKIQKDIQGKINAALKDPTPQKRLDVVNSISKIDVQRAVDVNVVLDAYNDAITGKSREDVQKKLKKVKNPELLAGAEQRIDEIFQEKEGRIAAESAAKKLEVENRTEKMTGLGNLNAYTEVVNAGAGPTIKFDLDGLKLLNDTEGKSFANKVWKEKLAAVQNVLREYGIDNVPDRNIWKVFREGGDEH